VPESGDLIGPYRLISQLGRGAMGEVWRARDERLDRYVALKVLPPDASGDLERRARMLREARAAAAIPHRNVVTLFDIVPYRGEDILVMELVEGRTIADVLRRDGVPPLATALRWIEEIADALVAAHARGVLHRDIKSANVMTVGDTVKILDFGLAKLRGDTVASVSAAPRTAGDHVALDATMPGPPHATDGSLAATISSGSTADLESYRTHAGQLLGTPLYMAPEQIDGAMPDERSEMFSVGVLAYEILTGKPPYTATTLDELFRQIKQHEPAPLQDVPDAVATLVRRALAKDPAARPSMQELAAGIASARRRAFAPSAKRWPLLVAAAVILLAGIGVLAWWLVRSPSPVRPGDTYVRRALEEYDVFYNDKAVSSLRAALREAPLHPRANAYMILFGGGSEADRATALEGARQARASASGTDRALVDAAIALVEGGPERARAALETTRYDRELAFWAAELDYRAGDYASARTGYAALLADRTSTLRGRIYDHYSSVLLYFDEPAEALRIGTLYRDAFPGEADAVGVYATTLSAAGKHEEAIAAAEEALRLSEGEDTLAGLGKVLALAGETARARALYQRSLDRAVGGRRPVRRAALALLQWIEGDVEAARATVNPCLAGGQDATARERGACVFVAGIIDPEARGAAIDALEALAAKASELEPAYGAPGSLAALVRARASFFGGACLVDPRRADLGGTTASLDARPTSYEVPIDFYAAYHVPFFATWAACERAALVAATGDRAGARAILEPIALRAPNRAWLIRTIKSYE